MLFLVDRASAAPLWLVVLIFGEPLCAQEDATKAARQRPQCIFHLKANRVGLFLRTCSSLRMRLLNVRVLSFAKHGMPREIRRTFGNKLIQDVRFFCQAFNLTIIQIFQGMTEGLTWNLSRKSLKRVLGSCT